MLSREFDFWDSLTLNFMGLTFGLSPDLQQELYRISVSYGVPIKDLVSTALSEWAGLIREKEKREPPVVEPAIEFSSRSAVSLGSPRLIDVPGRSRAKVDL